MGRVGRVRSKEDVLLSASRHCCVVKGEMHRETKQGREKAAGNIFCTSLAPKVDAKGAIAPPPQAAARFNMEGSTSPTELHKNTREETELRQQKRSDGQRNI